EGLVDLLSRDDEGRKERDRVPAEPARDREDARAEERTKDGARAIRRGTTGRAFLDELDGGQEPDRARHHAGPAPPDQRREPGRERAALRLHGGAQIRRRQPL